MALTSAQLATLKAHILATPDLATAYSDGNLQLLSELLNSLAAPAYIVWKTAVPIAWVGVAFVASGLAALTSANNDRLVSFALWNPGGVNPSRADHRAFFDDVFSAASGASTRAALLALWKRSATRAEKLFATGSGSDASPSALSFEGDVVVSYLIGL